MLDRPIGEVFAFVSDTRNEAVWWRGVKRVEVVEPGRRYVLRARFLLIPADAHVTIVDSQPPQRFTVKATGLMTYTCEYIFTDGGLRLRIDIERLPQWLAPLFRLVLRHNLRRLRRILAH